MNTQGARPSWYDAGRDHVWPPYVQTKTAPSPLPVVRTYGSRLVLADGRELIDGIGSWWTACHGYNHPHIAAAVREQLEAMPHVMFGGLTHRPALDLARRLSALLPEGLDHVFFSDSGSVSVEVAMKMSLQFWLNRGVRGRTRFVAFRGGYHGDTLATMAVCDPEEGMHSLFAGVLTEHVIADLPRDDAGSQALDALLVEHSAEIAGIIVEPLVQGAGGMLFHPPEVLRALRNAADRHGILLILDEVFTGFGRTGSMFAMEQAGIVPDVVCLSKALTGGTMGLAATVAHARVFQAFQSDEPDHALMHGPTFMGNPLACAAANASLDLFEDGHWRDRVRRIEARLARGLEPCRGAPGVTDVRVMGAIGVVEFDRPVASAALCAAFVARGVWIRPMGRVVYLTPSFNIAEAELDLLTASICAEVCGDASPDRRTA